MTTTYTVNIFNGSTSPQNFFVFQQPSVFSLAGTVYSNSLGQGNLDGYNPQRIQPFVFSMTTQYYAGSLIAQGTIGVQGTYLGYPVAVLIDLEQMTDLTFINNNTQPDLSIPVPDTKPQGGAFDIVTPTFQNGSITAPIGLAGVGSGGVPLLSSFIIAQPQKRVYVQPVVKFYVQTGQFLPGTTVNFGTQSTNAALCDATSGTTTFGVNYNNDGSWTVTPG